MPGITFAIFPSWLECPVNIWGVSTKPAIETESAKPGLFLCQEIKFWDIGRRHIFVSPFDREKTVETVKACIKKEK